MRCVLHLYVPEGDKACSKHSSAEKQGEDEIRIRTRLISKINKVLQSDSVVVEIKL